MMPSPSHLLRYTKAFAIFLEEQKLRSLNFHEMRRVMNIVHVEGAILGISNTMQRFEGTAYEHRLRIDIFKKQTDLIKLTGNLNPEALLDQMQKRCAR